MTTDKDLADRRWFELDDTAWDAFRALLDADTGPTPKLAQLLTRPAP